MSDLSEESEEELNFASASIQEVINKLDAIFMDAQEIFEGDEVRTEIVDKALNRAVVLLDVADDYVLQAAQMMEGHE